MMFVTTSVTVVKSRKHDEAVEWVVTSRYSRGMGCATQRGTGHQHHEDLAFGARL